MRCFVLYWIACILVQSGQVCASSELVPINETASTSSVYSGISESLSSWWSWFFDQSPSTSSSNHDAMIKSFNLSKINRTSPPSNSRSLHKDDLDLGLLHNLVHPEEELQDEISDGEILQAVVSSLAQWNLQKMQRQDQKRFKRDEEVVCYKAVGCFRDEGPFDYLDLLPGDPDEINTRFYLNTQFNRDISHQMAYDNATSILSSSFNASQPSKVMIHGFGSSCHRVWAKEMRTALISVGDVNVICVDWENGANLPNYVRAAVNTRLVGRQVALLINSLNELTGSKNSDFHLIGFSLGAHVAGFAGAELFNLSRITGLDPAGPLFENYDPRVRLDPGDADLVDVIHSNGEKIYMGGLGAWDPMGDIDFYPNGGRMQKGCTNLFFGAVSDMFWSTSEENGRSLCNHRRAYKFFTDSVVPGCNFPAFACESYEKLLEGDCFPCVDGNCANMGYHTNKSHGKGMMYLATREQEPFCANQFRVQIDSSPNMVPITSLGKVEIVLIGADNLTETFSLTRAPDTELVSGKRLVQLIVPHPSFAPPSQIQIIYTAYHGWIYNGLTRWPIDKVSFTDSFGKIVSYCQMAFPLESGKAASVMLTPGDCQLAPNSVFNTPTWATPSPDSVPLQSMDNEIAILDPLDGPLFRSLEHNTTGSNNTIDKASDSVELTFAADARHNSTNVYPYGNVPLTFLQQKLPADIKIGGNSGNSRKPERSFYQAASYFLGNQGNQVRARFRSFGSNRRQDTDTPQIQLTPPALQQRTFHRNRNPLQRKNDPSRTEYFLLRQQQLHLQQLQQVGLHSKALPPMLRTYRPRLVHPWLNSQAPSRPEWLTDSVVLPVHAPLARNQSPTLVSSISPTDISAAPVNDTTQVVALNSKINHNKYPSVNAAPSPVVISTLTVGNTNRSEMIGPLIVPNDGSISQLEPLSGSMLSTEGSIDFLSATPVLYLEKKEPPIQGHAVDHYWTSLQPVRKQKMIPTGSHQLPLMPQMRIVNEPLQGNRPRYIPLNPVDRQNRQLQVHPLFNEPIADSSASFGAEPIRISSQRKYVEYLVYPQVSGPFSSEPSDDLISRNH